MKKILFILNPVSGTMKAKNALFEVLNIFCENGLEVTVEITQRRGHAAELAASAENRGFDGIVCCGGDGTVKETITGIIGSGCRLPLGYIPAGSTNDFGNSMGLPQVPAEAAKLICRGTPTPVDAGMLNSSYFCYVACFGAFTKVSYSVSQDLKNVFGYMAYLIEGLKDIPGIRPVKVGITSGGEDHSGEYIFGAVSNARTVAGILHPDNADLSDGLFEVILVKKPKDPIEMSQILAGGSNSDFSYPVFEYFKTPSIDFHMDNPVNWSLDGEKYQGEKDIHIENLQHRILLIK